MHSIGQRIRLWRNGHDAPNGIVLRLFRCGTVNDNALEANKKSTWSFVTGGSPTRLRDTTRMMAISCSRAVVASGDGEGEFRLRTARAGAGRRCRAALPALQPPRCGTQITDMPGVAAAALRRHAADRQMADAREVAGAHAQPARLRTSSFAALETTPLAQTSSGSISTSRAKSGNGLAVPSAMLHPLQRCRLIVAMLLGGPIGAAFADAAQFACGFLSKVEHPNRSHRLSSMALSKLVQSTIRRDQGCDRSRHSE